MSGPDFGTVLRVLERDSHSCVRCGVWLRGDRGYNWSIQHRRARQAGGSRLPDTDQPQNLISVCGSGTTGCHGFIEDHPTEAGEKGWRLDQMTGGLTTDPLQHAVLVDHGSRWTYLTVDGEYSDNPPVEAA